MVGFVNTGWRGSAGAFVSHMMQATHTLLALLIYRFFEYRPSQAGTVPRRLKVQFVEISSKYRPYPRILGPRITKPTLHFLNFRGYVHSEPD
jgi:hypothetical protein